MKQCIAIQLCEVDGKTYLPGQTIKGLSEGQYNALRSFLAVSDGKDEEPEPPSPAEKKAKPAA